MMRRMLGVHLGLYAIAGAFAWQASVSEDLGLSELETQLWKVQTSTIKRVHYKDGKREVELQPRSDDFGGYLVGSVTKTALKPKSPHAAPPGSVDAGTSSAASPPEPATTTERFVGVTDANELLGELAALSAIRSLGAVTKAQLEEFGLIGEETGSLTIELSSGTRELLFGGATPGGGDFYAQDKQSGNVYVIDGDLLRDVELADTRLMERKLLSESEGQVVGKVVLAQGDKRRAIIRSAEHASFWTDEAAPTEKDETLTNWMKKFERLRVNEYVAGEPEAYEPLVTATFESAQGTPMGRIEFGQQRLPGEDKPRFLARSPQTRWWGVVLSSSGSQLAQDLPTVLE